MQHSIGILLLHWRDIPRTEEKVNKLLAWSKLDFHLYLIQNGTDEDHFPAFENERLTKIVSPQNLGFSGGNNLGLQRSIEAQHDYSFLLNPDANIEESELIKLVNEADGQAQLFSISPVIVEHSDGKQMTYLGGKNIASYLNTRILETEVLAKLGEKQLMEVFYNIGAAMLINNTALKEVGLLDTDYFFSGEIADICQRARNKNYRSLTLLNAKAEHHLEEQKLRSSLYRYYSMRNRFLFMKKHKQYKSNRNKWRKVLLKEIVYETVKLNYAGVRTMLICASDAGFGRFGNRNSKFKKQISKS